MKTASVIVAALIALALLPHPALAGDKRPRVLAAYAPLWIIADNISAGNADCDVLVPPGMEMHEFTLRPSDMRAIRRADLVIVLGQDLDIGIERLLPQARHAVEATYGIKPASGESGEPDPHMWLDPVLAARMAGNMADALAREDKKHGEDYARAAREFSDALAALDEKIRDVLAPHRGSVLMSYHEAFNYFAARYGLVPASLVGVNSEQPTPASMRRAYDMASGGRVRAVFSSPGEPSSHMDKLAGEIGVPHCTLNTFAAGPLERDAYVKGMLENARTIARCFGDMKGGR